MMQPTSATQHRISVAASGLLGTRKLGCTLCSTARVRALRRKHAVHEVQEAARCRGALARARCRAARPARAGNPHPTLTLGLRRPHPATLTGGASGASWPSRQASAWPSASSAPRSRSGSHASLRRRAHLTAGRQPLCPAVPALPDKPGNAARATRAAAWRGCTWPLLWMPLTSPSARGCTECAGQQGARPGAYDRGAAPLPNRRNTATAL